MKKLLFLTAAIGFAFSLNAQQIQVREQTPVSIQKALPLAKPANILNANTTSEKKAVQKSTNAPTYTYIGEKSNTSFADRERGNEGGWGSCLILFPDSLPLSAVHYEDAPDSNRASRNLFTSAGFAFDPYSSSFDKFGENNGLFSSKDTFYGYKIDQLSLYADYRIVNSTTPDTLRFYAWTHEIYPHALTDEWEKYPTSDRNYYYLKFTSIDRYAIAPIIEYSQPIPQKGPFATTPKANSSLITFDYILSATDSVDFDLSTTYGYVSRRQITVQIPGDGLEAKPKEAACFLVKYIPGDNNYSVNDTMDILTRSYTDKKWTGEEIRMNRFQIWYWNYSYADGTIDYSLAQKLFDMNGYNSTFWENMSGRYDFITPDATYIDRGLGKAYIPNYYAKAIFEFELYKSNEFWVDPNVTITEANQLISAIYPNPATSQLTIDLKEEGQANVAIYNVLGQSLIQKNVYNLSNTINVSTLSPGMYIVKLTQNGKVHTVRFSKD